MRISRADLVLVGSLAAASAVLLNVGVVCSNDGANYALISALGDGTTIIDGYEQHTFLVDYSMRDGHYYSPRAPGTAFLLMPFFFVGKLVSGGHDPTVQFVTGLGPALFGALLAMLMYAFIRRLGYSRGAGIFTALALCLGTPLRSYASGPWSHTIAAFFSLALVWVAYESITAKAADDPRRAMGYAAGLGALSACVVSVDYSGVLYATVVLVIVVVSRGRRGSWRDAAGRWALPIIAMGLLCMLPALGYHRAAFGSPFRTGYDFVVGQYAQVQHLSGMYGGSFFEGLLGLLFHPRAGLFVWSPILIAGVIAYRPFLKALPSRAVSLLFTLPALVMILLTANYHWWDGGGVHDVRFITQSLPLIALPVAAAADRSVSAEGERRRLASFAFVALFVASLVLQAVKHHAYWARDGSAWLPRFRDAGDRLPEVIGRFAAWCWPHAPTALVMALAGVALWVVLKRSEARAASEL